MPASLPDVLTSPQLTAEWENTLTAIAKGEADPDGFMAGIEEMTRSLISGYSQISEDAQKLFQKERVAIGKCPRCGEALYEGKKNYYCGNRACQFVMWKNDRFFEERGKAFTPKIAAALLKDGKAKVKGLRSMKTGKTYDGTVLLADTGGNTSTIALNGGTKTKNSKHRKCSHTSGKSLTRPPLPGRGFCLLGNIPKPLFLSSKFTIQLFQNGANYSIIKSRENQDFTKHPF